MKKLHVFQGGKWLPVFCYVGGRVITCENEPRKALPQKACWGPDDLKFFQSKYGDHKFELLEVK